MFASQSPIDDRCPGLAERPDAFLPQAADPPSSAAIIGDDPAAALQPGLDRAVMSRQLEMACRYATVIERVAARHALTPSIIAGFCSRRSGLGLDLGPIGADGTRDLQPRPPSLAGRMTPLPPDGLGYVRGLMGLDVDRHPLAREAHWRDPERNLEAAFAIVAEHRRRLRRVTTLQGTGLLRAALTAFECGLGPVERAIRRGEDVDSPTPASCRIAGRGCGRDVLARARFFQAEGWD